MPSRRTFLTAVSAISAAGVAGCLDTLDTTTGFVWNKSITVEVSGANERTVTTDLLSVSFERGENILHGEYDPEYATSAVDDRFVTVSDDLHEALEDQFRDIRYRASITPTEGRESPVNAAATRTAFNELTLGGRATVSTRSGENGFSYLEVHNTEPQNHGISDSNIESFDLDARINSEP